MRMLQAERAKREWAQMPSSRPRVAGHVGETEMWKRDGRGWDAPGVPDVNGGEGDAETTYRASALIFCAADLEIW